MAGVSEKEIKTRIRSMKSTRQITKAMEMVAASKLRRAQEKVLVVRPYYETLCGAMESVLRANRDLSSPYLVKRSGNKTLYLVIAGDRGMAGGYNGNIFKQILPQVYEKNATVLPIGRKAVEFFQGREVPVLEGYIRAEAVSVGDCFTLAKMLAMRYLAGEFDEIGVVYTDFVSVLSQIPTFRSMLPLRREGKAEVPVSGGVLFEPDSREVFERIVPEYLGCIVYGALCESRASEQAARRMAMDAATKNAEEMIDRLHLQYNRARQAAITQEITEIVAGSQ